MTFLREYDCIGLMKSPTGKFNWRLIQKAFFLSPHDKVRDFLHDEYVVHGEMSESYIKSGFVKDKTKGWTRLKKKNVKARELRSKNQATVLLDKVSEDEMALSLQIADEMIGLTKNQLVKTLQTSIERMMFDVENDVVSWQEVIKQAKQLSFVYNILDNYQQVRSSNDAQDKEEFQRGATTRKVELHFVSNDRSVVKTYDVASSKEVDEQDN